MKTNFDIGDHVLIPFEVVKIVINNEGKIRYFLTADYPPFDDEIMVEDEAFIIAKEIENDA